MDIDTNALMQAKAEIESQLKKFKSSEAEVTRLLTTELTKVWVDEASEKLNEKYKTEGQAKVAEVEKILTSLIAGIEETVDQFNNSVNSIGNQI